MGQVQHYFRAKDDMLLFAFHTISERVEQRIRTALADAGPPDNERTVLRALLVELLPLSEQAREEAPMWVAFLARAILEPRLAEILREGVQGLRGFVGEQIRSAQQAGRTPTTLDPDSEATTLLALADGLMLHMLIGQLDAATALASLDYHLDHIFPRPA